MIASLEERPCSPISILRREHKDLLDRLASNSRTQIRCCAAQQISYFQHWHEWKELNYPTRWVYQPLRDIQKDLMGAYTLHVIRAALDLLEELGFLSIRRNDRQENGRNGQDKTHQYLLNSDRIEEALKKIYSPKKTKTRKNSSVGKAETSVINNETPRFTVETPRFTVETHTQIPSTDSCTNSCSLLKERKEIQFLQEEDEDPWTVEEIVVEQEVVVSLDNKPEISQEQQDFGEDQFSAALEPKCFEVVQNELKPLPKLKSDRVSGFRSDVERDGFYQELLELGKTKGVHSPVAWCSAIIKSINAGEPCQYLIEYREGHQVGSCERQEWESAPGMPLKEFLAYLKVRNKKAEMTDEQVGAMVHQQLKDVNLARSLWESCKRFLANTSENWEKQKRLGVSSAYVPPELLPEREVSLEQVAGAIEFLQSGCTQLQAAGLESARAKLEPAKEVVTESAIAEPEPERLSMVELQEKLNLPKFASLIRMRAPTLGYRVEEDLVLPAEEIPSLEHLRSLLSNPITARKVKRLIAAHPEWGFWIDAGEIQDF